MPAEAELFRLFTQHSTDVLGLLDGEGRYLYVSAAVERLLGFPPEHFVGRNALEFLHPEDAAWAASELARTASGAPARGVVRTRHADGSWRWVEGEAMPVTTSDGHRRVVTIGRDVTARHAAEEARRAAEERLHRYQEIFLRSNDGIAAIDPKGRYVEQNGAHRDLLGYSDDELRGQTPAVHLGEEAFARIVAGLTASGRFRGEFVSLTKEGRQVPVELSAFSLTDAEGRVLGHVGIKRDMSGRHRVETEQRRRLQQLQVLYELNATTATAEQPEQVHEAALDALCAALGTDRASVLLYDHAGTMRFRAWRGLSEAYRSAVEGHSPWRRDDPDPRPVLVADVEQEPSLGPYQELFRSEGIRALAFLPLRDRGVLLGKLMVYHRAPHAFLEDELHVAQTIAGHVAAAVARQAGLQALAEQRNLLQAVLEGLQDPAWLKDLQGRYLMINPAGARITGRPVEQVLGRTAREMFGPASATIDASDQKVLATGEPLTTEDVLPYQGKLRTFLVKRAPFRDHSARVTGVIGLARDITDRKEAERALRSSEERFRSIVGNIPGLVYRCELRAPWRFDYISEGALELTGHTTEAFLQQGLTWASLIHAEDLPKVDAAVEVAVQRREPFILEYRIRRKDGELRWIQDRGRTVYDAEGRALHFEGVVVDIAERKRAEEALAGSEQRFRSLSACSPVGIFLADPAGNCTYTNPSCREIIGCSEAQAQGYGWSTFVHPDHAPQVAAEWRRITGEGGQYQAEFRFVNPRTGDRWVRVRSAPLVGDQGEVLGHVGTVEDVTERRAAEETLRASEERLRRQNEVLLRLAGQKLADPSDLDQALSQLTEAAAETLGVERASVWLYNEARDRIECADLYERSPQRHSRGATLDQAKYPSYFRAMAEERTIAVDDALRDPRTAGFGPGYLTPLGIGAMLDAPLRVGGRVVGVVCHEHVGGPRAWSPEERQFAATIADFASLALTEADRTSAEEALRLQGRVLESMTEGVSLTDEDGIILYTNPAEDRMFGYDEGELVGKHVTVQNAWSEEENERRVAEVIQALRQRGSWHGEFHNRRKDGSDFWTEAHITALELGGRRHWVCVQSDVTERRRAREERERLLSQLELEQARLTALVEQMPSAVIIADAPSGRLVFGNAQVQRVWRHPFLPAEDVSGYTKYRGFHPDGRPYEAHEWPLARAIRGEVVVGEEIHHERGDGTRGWMRINAAPIRDAAGTLIAGVVVFDDITDIKQTQVALHHSTRQQAVVAELGQLALRSTDLQPLVDRATALVVELLGADYSCFVEVQEEGFFLRGGSCFRDGWVGAWKAPHVEESLPAKVLATRAPVVVGDYREEGVLAPALLSEHGVRSSIAVPVVGARGIQAILGAHARRPHAFSEDKLRFLEAVGNVLAAALRRHDAEAALKAANERLQELDRLKTQFLNTVAHELRTPLTPLTLQLEIFKQSLPAADPHRRNVAILDRNMQRLSVLVEDILDVARLQGGRLTLHPLPLDLDKLVGDVAETFQEPARRANVTLEVRPGRVGRVVADPQRIGQVLFNLLSNAVKFTPAGGKVEVSTSLRGSEAVVQVRDSGAGLEPHQLQRLFQPFSQVHDTAARTSGTGLGLFISRGIVEQHGGSIWCESAGNGQGSTFTFALPLQGPPPRQDDETPAGDTADRASSDVRPDVEGFEGPRRSGGKP